MESHGVIQVLYEGAPVWLESVREGSAEVTNLQTKARLEVPLSRLEECT
jgi:H-type small acid-soluble spore protein